MSCTEALTRPRSARHAKPQNAKHLDRRISSLLYFGVLAVYLAVDQGNHYAYDGNTMLAVASNLVNHGTLKTLGALDDPFHLSTPYAPYGIAMSLLGAVPIALAKVFGHTNVLISVVNPAITAGAVVVTYRVGRALDWLAIHALLAATAFGLLTMALVYSTEYFSEPAVTLCCVVLVLGIIRWGQRRPLAPLMVGLAAAAALQVRSDSLVTIWIGLLAIPLFVPRSELRRLRSLVMLSLPLVLSLVALGAYNHLRYAKYFVDSYGGVNFTTPIGTGLHGYLLSSGKSLLLFNPLTALGVVGLVLLAKRNGPLAALFVLLIVTRMIFFARLSSWDGGWSWGPRFLLPIVPLLILSAVEVLRATKATSVLGVVTRVAAGLLAAASVVVNYLSVRVPYQQWLQVLATPMSTRFHVGPFNSGAVFNAYTYNPNLGPMWGDVRLLRHHLAEMGPELWRDGHGIIGGAILVVGAALLAWAALEARRGRRDGTAQSSAPAADPAPSPRHNASLAAP